MARVVNYSHEENLEDAGNAARLFLVLDRLPMPVIGRVHGAAIGGGAGLCAVCDVVVAADDAVFGFTEVKLGIIPAMIAPFVLAKIGRSAARELFLTGARFSAGRAREIGLVHAVVPRAELDATVEAYIHDLLAAGPEAVAAVKALIPEVARRGPADATSLTAEALARRRVSKEGQEGLRAFLERRPPAWVRKTTGEP
jgi:methylglutaconyl-CoA hydratase